MSIFSNANTPGLRDELGGLPRQGAVIRVHCSFVNQRQLSQGLGKICKTGTFKVEMRHNVYMIYLSKDDVIPVTSLLSDGQQLTLRSSPRDRQGRCRDSEDTVFDASELGNLELGSSA